MREKGRVSGRVSERGGKRMQQCVKWRGGERVEPCEVGGGGAV